MRQASNLIQTDQVFAWTLVVITLIATLCALWKPRGDRVKPNRA